MNLPFKFDFEKAKKLWDVLYKEWKRKNGSLILPNGFLGDIPIHITSFDFSSSNSVTSNKTFMGKELTDNINVEPYSISLTIICFGKEYINELKSLRHLTRNKIGSENIISLKYTKYNEDFSPLVITDISFTDSAESTMFQEVSLNLKNIDIRTYDMTNGIITTSTLSKNDSIKIKEPVKYEFPSNLKFELGKNNQYEVIKNAL